MYHSLDIETFPSRGSGSLKFNTYKDFYLVPTSLPIINPPAVKTKYIEVPGANGVIDLTESLTPFPVYQNRTGSIEFAVLNDRLEYYTQNSEIHGLKRLHALDSKSAWAVLYSDLMNKLHGRKCKIILEDDIQWYYEGRIHVSAWTPSNDGHWPTVTLDYDLYPYKLSVADSITGATETGTDRWLWDPFSFVDGVIYTGLNIPNGFTADGVWKSITLNKSSFTTYGVIKNTTLSTVTNRDLTGWMPVSPSISVNGTDMGIKIINPELGYTYEKNYTSNGTYTDPECLLYDYLGDGYTLQLKGNGTFTINFRKGSL